MQPLSLGLVLNVQVATILVQSEHILRPANPKGAIQPVLTAIQLQAVCAHVELVVAKEITDASRCQTPIQGVEA